MRRRRPDAGVARLDDDVDSFEVAPEFALRARDVARVPVDDRRRRRGGVFWRFLGRARETAATHSRCARSQRCTAPEEQSAHESRAAHVCFSRVQQRWAATLGNLWPIPS